MGQTSWIRYSWKRAKSPTVSEPSITARPPKRIRSAIDVAGKKLIPGM
jgi:hypothetical protein